MDCEGFELGSFGEDVDQVFDVHLCVVFEHHVAELLSHDEEGFDATKERRTFHDEQSREIGFESGKERDVVCDGAEELGGDLLEINGETFEFRVTERRVRRCVCCRYDLSLETFEEGKIVQEFETTVIRER